MLPCPPTSDIRLRRHHQRRRRQIVATDPIPRRPGRHLHQRRQLVPRRHRHPRHPRLRPRPRHPRRRGIPPALPPPGLERPRCRELRRRGSAQLRAHHPGPHLDLRGRHHPPRPLPARERPDRLRPRLRGRRRHRLPARRPHRRHHPAGARVPRVQLRRLHLGDAHLRPHDRPRRPPGPRRGGRRRLHQRPARPRQRCPHPLRRHRWLGRGARSPRTRPRCPATTSASRSATPDWPLAPTSAPTPTPPTTTPPPRRHLAPPRRDRPARPGHPHLLAQLPHQRRHRPGPARPRHG